MSLEATIYINGYYPDFDEDERIIDVPMLEPSVPPIEVPPPVESVSTCKTVKVVRSANGDREMRLLVSVSDPTKFVIRTEIISPNSKIDKELVRPRGGRKAFTVEEATEVFMSQVLDQFPDATLRNGKQVPTHKVIM